MSPTIQLAVNGKMLSAVIGSEVTLIKESTVSRLHLNINTRHTLPRLAGVTGKPLRVLGATRVTIAIGYKLDSEQWVPVVPDHYLDTDMLLGVDVLNKATLTWNAQNESVVWGEATYPIRSIPQYKVKSTKKVKQSKSAQENTSTALRASR